LTALVIGLLVAGALVLLASAPAFAAFRHPFQTSFGTLNNPQGIAVDQSNGDVYVLNVNSATVDRFDSSGAPKNFTSIQLPPGSNELNGSNTPATTFGFDQPYAAGIAVDNSGGVADGDIYVADSFHHVVDVFSQDGSYLGQLTGTPGAFGETCGVSVAGNGAVLVGDFNGKVHKFTPTTNPPTNADFTADVSQQSPCQVAGDSTGGFYAVTWTGGPIHKYNAAGADQGVFTNNGSGVAVNLTNDNVLVNNNFSFDERSSGGTVLSTSPSQGNIGGLAVNDTTGRVYATNMDAGRVDVYGPAVTVADVTTGAASSITNTGANVAGSVTPLGGETTCTVEYGTDTNYGQSVPCSPDTITEGSSPVAVTASIAGLDPSTTYHYRVSADNGLGTSTGDDRTFRTTGPPTVDETSAQNVGGASATLEAQVNPSGFSTTYHFDYVDDTEFQANGFTNATHTAELGLGSGSSDRTATTDIDGLDPNTTYHFRVVATNSQDTTEGPDTTFATTPPLVIDGEFATDVGAESATLNAFINPEGLDTTYHFEYVDDTEFQANGYTNATHTTDGNVSGIGDQQVQQPLTGLDPNTTYHFRVVASNSLDTVTGDDTTFATTAAVGIDAVSVKDVTSTGATLTSQINPEGLATTVHFEYGPTPALGTSTPTTPLAAGLTDQPVNAHIMDLDPDSTYFYKVVGSNDAGTVDSAVKSFHTFAPAAGFTLPDSRAFEQVSPVDKNGGDISALSAAGLAGPQASHDGQTVTYTSMSAFGNSASAKLLSTYTAKRSGSGWASTAIATAQEPSNNLLAGLTVQYSAFSQDLSHAVLLQNDPALAAGAAPHYMSLYRRDNTSGSYDLLTKPDSLGTLTKTFDQFQSNFGSASPDFSHVAFEVNDSLFAGDPTVHNLYEWTGGNIRLVSVLPGAGGPAPSGGIGDGADFNAQNAISSNGQLIFWTDGSGQLYVRRNGTSTDKVNASKRTVTLGDGTAVFRGANVSGSKVFFTDDTPLTDDANDNGGLYEYDTGGNTLTNLTPNSGGNPGINGLLGLSDDGSFIYFVAQAVLDTGATNGANNLYALHDGGIRFIATLSGDDSPTWAQQLTSRVAHVTPDGRHVAFVSDASLTGFDNHDATSGSPDNEVFVYDYDSNDLACASCNPGGSRPLGPATIPTWGQVGLLGTVPAFYQPRSLSDDGSRVFFTTSDSLQPRDVNHKNDAYEYAGGKARLLTLGTSSAPSSFVDASPSGDDTFVLTRDPLVPQDSDTLTDLYDARVNGGFPNPPAATPCSGDGCRGPLSSPPAANLAPTTSFVGPGNVTAKPKPRHKATKKKAKKKKHKSKKKKSKKSKKAKKKSHKQSDKAKSRVTGKRV
jgi:phosphodiesterase/alkaline phosphatase D-like protein